MILHFGTELPPPRTDYLDHETPDLTDREMDIIRLQIRRNSRLIDEYVRRLDLLVNKERYPHQAAFIRKIRRQLELLMEENDTFRKVIWKYFQQLEIRKPAQPV